MFRRNRKIEEASFRFYKGAMKHNVFIFHSGIFHENYFTTVCQKPTICTFFSRKCKIVINNAFSLDLPVIDYVWMLDLRKN